MDAGRGAISGPTAAQGKWDPSGRAIWSDNGAIQANQDGDAIAARQTFGNAFTTHNRSSTGNLYGTENVDLAAQTPMTREGNYNYLQAVSQRANVETGGHNDVADIGMYQLGGDPHAAQNYANSEFAKSAAAQGRQGVALDQSGITPWQMGMGSQAQQLGALGQQGAGSGLVGQQGQAQANAGNALMALGQQAPGPSAAELAMRQQGQANIAGQAALAAGARGGNTGLALQNAAQNQAAMGGQLQQQLGVQRASEDLANRQFQAQALGQAAGVFGGAGNTFAGQTAQQQNALVGAAGVYGQGASLNAGLAGQNAQLQAQQRALNDQTSGARDQMGYGLLGQQLAANSAFDSNRTKNDLDLYGIQRNTQYHGASTGERIAGAGLQAGGTIVGAYFGGPGGAVAGNAAGTAASNAIQSDIRAKKDIRPAAGDVSQAFRTADATAAQVRNAPVEYPSGYSAPVKPTDMMFSDDNGGTFRTPDEQYAYQFGVKNPGPDQQLADFRRAHVDESTRPLNAPAYSYQYKNPAALGAAPGTKYGPMAQDLEKTPAGASVVGTDKSGKKFVDPGRLSLLTASEVSKQRKELDALNAQIANVGRSVTAYPTPQAPQPYAFGSR